jgi:hypothetical protein
MGRTHLSIPTAPKSSPSTRIGSKRKAPVHPSLADQISSLEEEIRECCDAIHAPCWGAVAAGNVTKAKALALVAKGLGIDVSEDASEEEVRFLLVEYVTSRGGSADAAEAVAERAAEKGRASMEEALAKRNAELTSGLQAQQARFGLLLHAWEEVRFQVLNGLFRPLGKKSSVRVLGRADKRQGWMEGVLGREGASIDTLREYAKVLASRRDSLRDRAKVAKTLAGACSLARRAEDANLLLKEVYARIKAIRKGEDRIPTADQELTVEDLVDRLKAQDLV